mmetsp:Transcript_1849/g.4808  ORF Transcript_1849/g.4808 Transcript_1849/m.4808 type:complete len:117 (+) Transcript_1849:216-566(+)
MSGERDDVGKETTAEHRERKEVGFGERSKRTDSRCVDRSIIREDQLSGPPARKNRIRSDPIRKRSVSKPTEEEGGESFFSEAGCPSSALRDNESESFPKELFFFFFRKRRIPKRNK